MIPVVVPTSDPYLHLLPPFAYLFNTYWSSLQDVTILGYKGPEFGLPPNFHFLTMGDDPGQERWSDGVIEFLMYINDPQIILLLDDYWLCRTVDTTGISTLAEYLTWHPDVLRMDLTTDRLYNGQMFELESYGHYDIIETPHKSPYQMSLQAGIWNRSLLWQVLTPGKSPWQIEIETQPPEHMRVLGTRQCPVRYANVCKGGDPGDLLNLGRIDERHLSYMRQQGWL